MDAGMLSDDKSNTLTEEDKNNKKNMAVVSEIVIACPAGVGSSAVGANLLRKKLKEEGLNISVKNVAIKKLTDDIDLVITQSKLTEEAKGYAPSAIHISLTHFLDNKLYASLVASLKEAQQ
jgi:PTS system mannitol-specific IIC component